MPTEYQRILVRATNWVGDAVMSLPALQLLRGRFPKAHIAVLARPWVADIYAGQPFADEVILHNSPRGAKDLGGKWRLTRLLREKHFDAAILLQNAFEAAAIVWLAAIPNRIGYNRDGRGFLLTQAIPAPRKGEIPPHERFYYLELLKRAGLIESYDDRPPSLGGHSPGREPIVGVSPGAAFGSAKRWIPERFAEAAAETARALQARVSLFGSADESELCEQIAADIRARGVAAENFAGRTSLRQFIDLCAACTVYLTNDSGGMHIASALGVPTVAVFGATDHIATGPTGTNAVIVREPVECSPCKLRECPIDHRCMTRVPAARVTQAALDLLHRVHGTLQ